METGDFSEKKQIAEGRRDIGSLAIRNMINDNVLIEIDDDVSKLFIRDGVFFALDSDKNNASNTVRHGIVRKLPYKFMYRNDCNPGADWLNTIQINIGDRVWFNVVGSSESEKVVIGGKLYFIIRYRDLILSKRAVSVIDEDRSLESVVEDDGLLYEVVMLNGFTLVQPKMMEQPKSFNIPPKKSKDCIVCFCGESNVEYYKNNFIDDDSIMIGDTVRLHLFRGNLEDPLHKCFNGDNEYMVVQRRHLSYNYN